MTATAFWTAEGVRVPSVDTAHMREVDRIAVEEVGLNLYQMMENAGRTLAAVVLEVRARSSSSGSIAVLAGTGGNGGGGICAARHLANRGADVVLVVSDEKRLSAVPADQLGVYRATPGRLAAATDVGEIEPCVIVDALIGYSLSGPPGGTVAELIDWTRRQSAPVVSLDVPSGLDATSGEAPGLVVRPDVTLTLALPKVGLASMVDGELCLADIGIPSGVYHRAGIDVSPDTFGGAEFVRLQ